MYYGADSTTPGTKIQVEGQEYIAVAQRQPGGFMMNCLDCSFTQGMSQCEMSPCTGVVWMTPVKVITRRLTS